MTHCNDYCPDDNSKSQQDIKSSLYDATQSTSLKDNVLNNNDDNNNSNNNNQSEHSQNNVNKTCDKDKDVDNVDIEQELAINVAQLPQKYDSNLSETKAIDKKVDKDSPTNCISQFLNTIINFRRDEMTLNLNNLLTGANQTSTTSTTVSMQQQPPVTINGNNMLINDMNRSFMSNNSFNSEHALTSLMNGHQQYSKYGRGACKWPGCDLIFDDLQTFTK